VLKEIQGRSTDFVVAQDGTVMHGLALIYVVRDLPGIEAFKIEQESTDYVRVLIKPGPGFDSTSVPRIRSGFAARLGDGVRIDVEEVSEVPTEASGKFRYVVSRVAA
jgi:phenylacetate-CoA ligase